MPREAWKSEAGFLVEHTFFLPGTRLLLEGVFHLHVLLLSPAGITRSHGYRSSSQEWDTARLVIHVEGHTEISLLTNSESRGWGDLPWCGYLKPKLFPQPCVLGQAYFRVPLAPFPSVAVSQGLGAPVLLAGDGLCWITRVQEAPYSSDEVTTGEHTQGAGRCVREGECRAEDCLWPAPSVWLQHFPAPANSTTCVSICWQWGPEQGVCGKGIWCWGGVCITHISGLFVTAKKTILVSFPGVKSLWCSADLTCSKWNTNVHVAMLPLG